MKTLGLIVTLLIGATLAVIPLLSSGAPAATGAAFQPQRPLVVVPGLLGSRLCRPGPDGEEQVVWGTVDAMGQFPTLRLVPESDDVAACGLIREISFLGILSQTVYGPFVDRLARAGYVEGKTLFVFDYDWRLSVADNAERLATFIDTELPPGEIDIVGHSMGGLISRTYALRHGGAERIDRLITAGSPWLGSVQAYELLQGGLGLGNLVVGGLEEFRRTIASFPSAFDLMPRYDGCCAAQLATAEAWANLRWSGLDAGALPDLAEAGARQAELQAIFAEPLPAGIEDAFVIGVDQRTPQSFELQPGDGEAQLIVKASWDGDGTVMEGSAVLADRIVYRTSFATHDALLSDSLVQDFVLASLASGPATAIRSTPVRERTNLLDELGQAIELIGVAIVTDQPAYPAATPMKVTVHLRLGAEAQLDANAIRLVATRPDGTITALSLVPDPAASDPSIPLEQSFSATLDSGTATGALSFTAVLENSVGAPRTATHAVPVLAN